jgi:hypothetical protein
MFGAAPPHTLNHLLTLRPHERVRVQRRGLAQAATDAQATTGYLSQFTSLWAQVKSSLAAMVNLPAALQNAANDLQAARQAAIDAGDSDTAMQAETLYADVLAHQETAAQVADKITQYRDTWNTIAASVSGTWGSVVSTVESWWLAAQAAVGLGVLPLIPLALLIAAVAALGFVAVTGLAVLAWWQTTSTTIEGVKAKVLPPSALGSPLFSGLSSTLMWGVGGVAVLVVLMMMSRK